jgi:hypothetical protein
MLMYLHSKILLCNVVIGCVIYVDLKAAIINRFQLLYFTALHQTVIKYHLAEMAYIKVSLLLTSYIFIYYSITQYAKMQQS